MMFNATCQQYFSYIVVWRSVLLAEETGGPRETDELN